MKSSTNQDLVLRCKMAERKPISSAEINRDTHLPPKENKQDDPPNSRLFIVCGKSVTEEDFREAFHKFGAIEEIWMVKDRITGEPKGVAYIKFSKTSEAATAMEEMNGRCIGSHPRPLKVLIAHSREQGSRRDSNEEERLLRLFVVVPKSMSDMELREHFAQFGDIDYVSIVKDKNTKESKGFAYVKYHRVSHAAKAFESCDRSFKPVFADPRPPKHTQESSQSNLGSASSTTSNFDLFSYENHTSMGPDVCNRLLIVAHSSLNQDQIWKLFDIIPGLDYCEKKDMKIRQQGRCQYVAVYNNPQAATYAKEKLHGFEYPPGQRLIVKYDYVANDFNRNVQLPNSSSSGVPYSGMLGMAPNTSNARLPFLSTLPNQGGMDANIQATTTTNQSPVGASYHGLIAPNSNAARAATLHSNLATIAETLAQATSIIQAAGLGQNFLSSPTKHIANGTDERNELMGHLEILGALSNQTIPLSPGQTPANNTFPGETYDPSYCSVKLPTPQPLAPTDSPVGERLFIVCQPTPPPIYVLKDIFGRFGHLIDVYMLGGRSCGYAKYAEKESADRALMTLHGQEVCGSRLKVMTAEPNPSNDSLRKRIRIEEQ